MAQRTRRRENDREGVRRTMTYVMLVGTDVALLEGLAQSLAGLGHRPSVTASLSDARDLCSAHPPLVLVVDRALLNTPPDMRAVEPRCCSLKPPRRAWRAGQTMA